MEKRGRFTITSLEEMLDKYIGAVGTPERNQFDKEVDEALDRPTSSRLTPSRSIHPGEILHEELEAREKNKAVIQENHTTA